MILDESRDGLAFSPGEIAMQWDVRIPLRDGLSLSSTLYLPRQQTKAAPVIFTLTPYVAQSLHETAVHFARHGYPFLTVDVRGRGNSDGVFKANGNEARDGYDIIEWLALQPYCNGKVAMCGGSYGGYVQWSAAKEFPPHLATIVPVASPFRGVDSPAPNNIFPPYRIQWLTLLAGRTSQDKIFADQPFWNDQFLQWYRRGAKFRQIDDFFGLPSAIFQEWLAHPRLDAYWDSYNPTPEQYAAITTPILTITGSYDTNQIGALTHYREHQRHASAAARARHFLIIGPWDHAGTRAPKAQFGGIEIGDAGLIDLLQLHRQWYAWTMEGGPKPPFLCNNVAYYVMGAEQWRYADNFDAITARRQPLYLTSNGNPTDVVHAGSLTVSPPPRSGPDQYIYDPRDTSLGDVERLTDPWNWVDQRMLYAATGRRLVYHSAPFEQDVEISGMFSLSVWLAIDQPDTDFRAVVSEVSVDGTAIQLSSDLLRARYRESMREEKLIQSREPLRYDFKQFTFISRLIRRGHRLRLVFGPLDSIFWQRNYNSGGVIADESIADARAVTVKLFHDEQHPSVLFVPIGRS